MAVTGGSPGSLDVLMGVGDGTLAAPQALAAGSHPTAVVLADFNGDGKLDAAVVNNGTSGNSGDPGGVSILLGNGDGTFQAPVNYSPGPLNSVSLAAADFNGDGKPDLAIVTRTLFNTTPIVPSNIVILLNNGNHTFRTGSTLQIDSTIQATAVAAGDLNGDGKADLAVAAFEEQGPGDGVAIFLGNGDGTFSAGTFLKTGEPGPVNLGITDLDGDGKKDIVVNFCCGVADATYLLGNGDGTFQAEQHILSGSSPVGLAVSDFNADGLPDLVFTTQCGNVVTWETFFPIVSGSCSYYIYSSSTSVAASGGGLTVYVSTTPACAWTLAGLPPWITASGAIAGSGPGTITLTAAPNSGGLRNATMNISGRLITVNQAAVGCGFGLSVGARGLQRQGVRDLST